MDDDDDDDDDDDADADADDDDDDDDDYDDDVLGPWTVGFDQHDSLSKASPLICTNMPMLLGTPWVRIDKSIHAFRHSSSLSHVFQNTKFLTSNRKSPSAIHW